jgi:DNA-binding FrmR family transcriptional regulator
VNKEVIKPKSVVPKSKSKHALSDELKLQDIIKRINRAHGQLGAVARMLEEGRDCEAVITQIAAVSKAINSAAFMLISSNLKECMIASDKDVDEVSTQLQKLFLSLA